MFVQMSATVIDGILNYANWKDTKINSIDLQLIIELD